MFLGRVEVCMPTLTGSELPDLFRFNDGTRVQRREEWPPRRYDECPFTDLPQAFARTAPKAG